MARGLCFSDGSLHLGSDFGGVGRAGTEDDLEVGVEVFDGVDKVENAFLAGNATDKKDIRLQRVDTEALEGRLFLDGAVFARVNPIVDNVDFFLGDLENAEDVVGGFLGDGDDGVGHVKGGALDPEAKVITSAELLAFPRTERLKGVDGDDKGETVVELGKDAAEMGIPSVTMDNLGVYVGGIEVEAALEGAKDRHELLGAGVAGFVKRKTCGGEAAFLDFLVAKAADFDVDYICQFAAEVFNMDACAAVNVRGIFVRKDECFHGVILRDCGVRDRDCGAKQRRQSSRKNSFSTS